MTKDLTNGRPFSLILGFSIPVLLGYLFQQFYNVADTIIVGKFLGVTSLAAVGSTGSVNFLIIGFVSGMCGGFAIPIAQRFGAKDFSRMRVYVSNSIYLCAIFAVLITTLTVIFCKPLLLTMQTPPDIVDQADSYIRIIFLGIPLIYLYNMSAGIIRSLGDSKTPVYFLVLSAVLNIILDFVFILIFKFGIRGAAAATIISQGIAGISCVLYMTKSFPELHCSFQEKKINSSSWASLCAAGIPMGLQYSITAIGSVILQSAVNQLGSSAVASVTAAGKVSQFFCAVFDSLGTTMATYGGQNTGAAKIDRLGRGVRDALILSAVYSLFCFLLFFVAGQYFILLFVDSSQTEIVQNAKLYLLENSSCYMLLAVVNVVRFMIQGMGFSRFSIFSGIFEMIARTIIGIFVVPRFGFVSAGLASPFAWLLADLFLIPGFIRCIKKLQHDLGKAKC